MASPVDIIIIGGGPAGLSTASSTIRQSHSTLILDSGKYRNEGSSHMHTVPTWDHRDPSEFREAARKDFDRYGTVKVENAEVASVKNTADGLFEATGTNGQVWTGRKLVLATGVVDIFPDIEGYANCWISGMSVPLLFHIHDSAANSW
jgi:thioredoxin reductase